MLKIKTIITHPLTIILLFAFIVTSWPIINYPLTDGDIAHWVGWAKTISQQGGFFTTKTDQAHGPLIVWASVPFIKYCPYSFYAYNIFNLLCGLLGLGFMYFFSLKIWKNKNLSVFTTFVFATSLVYIYQSRTPMYDWSAAIFYFIFCGFYFLHISEKGIKKNASLQNKYLPLALISIGIGSLSRMSITWGLAGLFMILTNLIYKKSFLNIFKEGILITLSVALFNLPFLLAQTLIYKGSFLKTFLWDNTGRFISDSPTDIYRKDWYGFTIYAFLGIFPYTFFALTSFFQRSLWQRVKNSKIDQMLLAGFLPCLIFFSFSGHVKLARYISYVFPMLIMFFSYSLINFDLKEAKYLKRCKILFCIIGFLLAVILLNQFLLFKTEAQSSILFVIGVILLVFSLLITGYFLLSKLQTTKNLTQTSLLFLIPFGFIYLSFFSILAYLYNKVPFLLLIKEVILKNLTN